MDNYRILFLMQQAYATLFSLANKLQVNGDKYLDCLTSRQYMTMIAIAHLPGDETTLNNIARKLGTTKQSVKQIIDILEKNGYVEIKPSPKDKRAINIMITKSGKHTLMEASEKGIFLLEDVFKELSEEEIESLWSILKKLYRYDGEEQDGFEEEGKMQMDEDISKEQERVLKKFEGMRASRDLKR